MLHKAPIFAVLAASAVSTAQVCRLTQQKVDVIFLLDNSPSMCQYLNKIGNKFLEINQSFSQAGASTRYGIGTFAGANTRILPMTNNVALVKQRLDEVAANCGNTIDVVSGREPGLQALELAGRNNWYGTASDAKKVIVFATDEDSDAPVGVFGGHCSMQLISHLGQYYCPNSADFEPVLVGDFVHRSNGYHGRAVRRSAAPVALSPTYQTYVDNASNGLISGGYEVVALVRSDKSGNPNQPVASFNAMNPFFDSAKNATARDDTHAAALQYGSPSLNAMNPRRFRQVKSKRYDLKFTSPLTKSVQGQMIKAGQNMHVYDVESLNVNPNLVSDVLGKVRETLSTCYNPAANTAQQSKDTKAVIQFAKNVMDAKTDAESALNAATGAYAATANSGTGVLANTHALNTNSSATYAINALTAANDFLSKAEQVLAKVKASGRQNQIIMSETAFNQSAAVIPSIQSIVKNATILSDGARVLADSLIAAQGHFKTASESAATIQINANFILTQLDNVRNATSSQEAAIYGSAAAEKMTSISSDNGSVQSNVASIKALLPKNKRIAPTNNAAAALNSTVFAVISNTNSIYSKLNTIIADIGKVEELYKTAKSADASLISQESDALAKETTARNDRDKALAAATSSATKTIADGIKTVISNIESIVSAATTSSGQLNSTATAMKEYNKVESVAITNMLTDVDARVTAGGPRYNEIQTSLQDAKNALAQATESYAVKLSGEHRDVAVAAAASALSLKDQVDELLTTAKNHYASAFAKTKSDDVPQFKTSVQNLVSPAQAHIDQISSKLASAQAAAKSSLDAYNGTAAAQASSAVTTINSYFDESKAILAQINSIIDSIQARFDSLKAAEQTSAEEQVKFALSDLQVHKDAATASNAEALKQKGLASTAQTNNDSNAAHVAYTAANSAAATTETEAALVQSSFSGLFTAKLDTLFSIGTTEQKNRVNTYKSTAQAIVANAIASATAARRASDDSYSIFVTLKTADVNGYISTAQTSINGQKTQADTVQSALAPELAIATSVQNSTTNNDVAVSSAYTTGLAATSAIDVKATLDIIVERSSDQSNQVTLAQNSRVKAKTAVQDIAALVTTAGDALETLKSRLSDPLLTDALKTSLNSAVTSLTSVFQNIQTIDATLKTNLVDVESIKTSADSILATIQEKLATIQYMYEVIVLAEKASDDQYKVAVELSVSTTTSLNDASAARDAVLAEDAKISFHLQQRSFTSKYVDALSSLEKALAAQAIVQTSKDSIVTYVSSMGSAVGNITQIQTEWKSMAPQKQANAVIQTQLDDANSKLSQMQTDLSAVSSMISPVGSAVDAIKQDTKAIKSSIDSLAQSFATSTADKDAAWKAALNKVSEATATADLKALEVKKLTDEYNTLMTSAQNSGSDADYKRAYEKAREKATAEQALAEAQLVLANASKDASVAAIDKFGNDVEAGKAAIAKHQADIDLASYNGRMATDEAAKAIYAKQVEDNTALKTAATVNMENNVKNYDSSVASKKKAEDAAAAATAAIAAAQAAYTEAQNQIDIYFKKIADAKAAASSSDTTTGDSSSSSTSSSSSSSSTDPSTGSTSGTTGSSSSGPSGSSSSGPSGSSSSGPSGSSSSSPSGSSSGSTGSTSGTTGSSSGSSGSSSGSSGSTSGSTTGSSDSTTGSNTGSSSDSSSNSTTIPAVTGAAAAVLAVSAASAALFMRRRRLANGQNSSEGAFQPSAFDSTANDNPLYSESLQVNKNALYVPKSDVDDFGLMD